MSIDYSWCRFQKNGSIKTDKDEIKIEKIEKKLGNKSLKNKKPIKKKSDKKRTKATDISEKVKKEVAKRDSDKNNVARCIICGKPGVPNAHYKKRSQGGLGIAKNIVTMCPDCHYEQDHGKDTKLYTKKIKYYLKSQYKDWNEKDLIYKKDVVTCKIK